MSESMITGIVYKIISPNIEECYIGSTTMTLKQRFANHISNWKHKKERCCSSYLIIEKGKATIELLEKVQVESERELEIIEQNWIDKTPNTVNIRRAVSSREDSLLYYKKYHQEHKELHNEYSKKHYQKHKDKIAEINSKKFQCPCGGKYTTPNKYKHLKTQKHQKYLENLDQDKE